VNKGNSGLEVEWVQVLGAVRSLQSKTKLSAEKRWQTHFLSHEEKARWIEDYVERETAVGRKRVEDAETVIRQEQENMSNVENARLTTTKPETIFEELLNGIRDSLSNLANSNDKEDGEDEDDDEVPELGKLSKDDEPGWGMGTISKTLKHSMESFQQKQMKIDQLPQPEWGDAADYFRERDMKYGRTELKVPAVLKPRTDTTAPTPSLTTFEELLQTRDIVRRHSHIPQVRSRPGSIQMRLGLEKPESHNSRAHLLPGVVPDSSQMVIGKPVEAIRFYPCI